MGQLEECESTPTGDIGDSFDDYGEPCPHCGEPMVWLDMFGIAWCDKIYWSFSDEYRP